MAIVLPNDMRAPFFRANRWRRVVNGGGVAIPPHSVVLITSTSKSAGEIVHTVRQPNAANTDFHWNRYLVTGTQAIYTDSDSEGLATDLSCPGYVRYDSSGTPAIGDVWGPKHAQFTLSKYYYGYEILGGNTTSVGNNVTVARWTGVASVKGKIDDTNVSALATCVVSVWDGARAGDTTMNVTGVVNPTTDLTSVNGKRCQVTFPGGVPELIFVECG